MNSQQNEALQGITEAITPAMIGSFLLVTSVSITAYLLANTFLPKTASWKTKLFFIWHAFDVGIHLTIEAPWLYHTFFTWVPVPAPGVKAPYSTERYTMPGVHFLGHADRLYGIKYATGPFASLWNEYAKADRRVIGSEPSIVCMELICVFFITPVGIYTCNLLTKGLERKAYFWMVVIAALELCMSKSYFDADAFHVREVTDNTAGFIMFGPEWLTGWPNLETDNQFYLWAYIIFFNAGIWIVTPLWVLRESYLGIVAPPARKPTKRA